MATTSAAGEDGGGMSAAIRVKLEAGAAASMGQEEDPQTEGGAGSSSDLVVRKVTVLDPLKLKLLARQDQSRLLTGLRTEQAKAKPPASTPAPTAAPAEPAPSSTPADDEPASQPPPPPPSDAPQPQPEPAKVVAPPKPAGTLFRRKKVVPVAVAKQISKRAKEPPKVAPPAPEPVKPSEPEVIVEVKQSEPDKAQESVELPDQVEENVQEKTTTQDVVAEEPPELVTEQPPPVTVKKEPREPERPTAFRRIKPKVSINIAKTRPRKSILKKVNSGTESEGGGSNEPSKSLEPEETIVLDDDDDDEEEEQNKAAKERQALEESRKAIEAEERRLIEEEMRKIQERDERIRQEEAENERRIAEERRLEEEHRRKEEEKRIEETKRIAEEQRISEQKSDHSKAEEKPSVVPARKSIKIPPDVWKMQLQKMKMNPFRMHSAPEKKPPQEEPPKEAPVTVESAPLEESQPPRQEVVNVVMPEEVSSNPAPPPPASSSATKEIRRISRLPPSVAMKLMNSVVAAGKVVKPKEQTAEPVATEQLNPEPTKTIRRISKLPPELARKLVQSVERKPEVAKPVVTPEVAAEPKPEVPNKEIRRISKLPPELARKLVQSIEKKPEVPKEVELQVATEVTPEVAVEPKPEVQTKEVRRIARLPAAVAMQLLSSVRKVKTEPAAVEAPKAVEDPKPEVKPTKEIRRISQLPPDVARKLMNSLKQQQQQHPKPVPLPIPEVKVEPEAEVAPVTAPKPKSKVHILSQVILPTSTSYNLEELLAGKSAEGMHSAPAGGQMPLPLPMPRARKAVEDLDTSRSTVDLNQSAGSSQTEEVIGPNECEQMPLPVQLKEEEDARETTEEANEGGFGDDHQVEEEANEGDFGDDHQVEEEEEEVQQSMDLPPSVACEEIVEESIAEESIPEEVDVEKPAPVVPVVSQIPQVPISTQPVQYSYGARPMPQPHVLSMPRSQPQVTYYQHVPNLQQQLQQLPPGSSIVYANSHHVSLPSRPHLSVQRLVLNPASIRSQPPQALPQPVRPNYGSAQFVLIRNSQPPRVRHPQPSQHHLLVPRPTYYQHPTASAAPPSQHRYNQILVPTPRFMVASVPTGQPPTQQPQQQQRSNYIIPSISPQKRAFQPVEPQALTATQIIPKIVIEPPPPSHTPDSPKELKNFSPCSQAVKDKLREKLRAKMGNKMVEPPQPQPQPALPLERPTDRMHFVPIVKPPPQPQQRTAPQITQIRPIKQYNAGPGRKIYLTKFCVVKPEQQAVEPPPVPPPLPPQPAPKLSFVVQNPPRPPPQRTQSVEVFHGFPSSSIKSERRDFERFRENLDKVVTAVSTAGPNGDEMYIITELDEPSGSCPVKEEPVAVAPPPPPARITVRRKTFVVEDSDCEARVQLLPRVDEGEEEVEDKKVQVKTEKVEPVTVKQESTEGEEDESSEEADEDLARQILSLVQLERDQLRIGASPVKVKRLRKRRKRRKRVVKKKEEDSKDKVMELLMKHVNQEALIADIVAAQRKELPIIELSDDGEDEICEEKPEVRIDTDSEIIVSDEEDSGSDIFAKILEPFTSEKKKPEDAEQVAAEISGVEPLAEDSAIAVEQTIEKRTDISLKPSNEEKEVVKICDTISSALPETAASTQAPRAPKRKLKPTLAVRRQQPQLKIQKTAMAIGRVTTSALDTLKATSEEEGDRDRAVTPASTATEPFGADDDSSDPFSDREDAVKAKICAKIVEESGEEKSSTPEPAAQVVPEEPVKPDPVAVPQEILKDSKGILRQIAEDWDIEETPEEPDKIEEPEKAPEPPMVALATHSMEAPAALISRPKSILKRRASVRIAGQQRPQRERTPERDDAQSVQSLLKDWEVTPEKPPAEKVNSPVRNLLKEWTDSPVKSVTLPVKSPEKAQEKTPVKNVISPVKNLLKEWEDTPQKVPEKCVASVEKSPAKDSGLPVCVIPLAEKSPGKVHVEEREKTPVRNVPSPVKSLPKDAELPKEKMPVETVISPEKSQDRTPSPVKNVTSPVKSPLKIPLVPHVLLERLDVAQYKSPEKSRKPSAVEPRVLLEKLDLAEYGNPGKPVENLEVAEKRTAEVPEVSVEPVVQEPQQLPDPEVVPVEPPKQIEPEPEIVSEEPPKPTEPQSDVAMEEPPKQPDPEPELVLEEPPVPSPEPSRSVTPSDSRPASRSLRSSSTRLSVSHESLPLSVEKEATSARSLRRMTRLSVSRESLPQAVDEKEPNKGKVSKQASIKNWLNSTTCDPPPVAPAATPATATRTLRSRVNSVMDVEPVKKKPRGRPKVVKPVEVEPPVEAEVAAVAEKNEEESGAGDRRREDAEKEAGANVGALEQEPKSLEPQQPSQPQLPRPKPPSPTISNRVPIPISSDSDDEDAPLAKRRKVLRKRRATARRTVRDLNDNRRLFRSANASLKNSAASTDQDDLPIIKSEPLEIPQQDAVPYEAFDGSSGRLLSIVTVQNNQIVHSEDYQDHIFATPDPPAPVVKRKRRTKAQIEADNQAKQAKRESTRGIEPVPLDPSAVPSFGCANCGEMISNESWSDHYAHHNGLTYRIGIDPEFNLSDEATAVQVVTRFMKQHRQLQVICEKCGTSKKSAMGYVSHRVICGFTPEQIEASKVACEHCQRRMMPVSMTTHLSGHCSVLKRIKQERHLEQLKMEMQQQQEEDVAADLPGQVNQLGRVKRRATKRAETKIKTMSCEDLIIAVTKSVCTDGCLGAWKTQLRKANTARCVFPSCDFTGNSEAEMRHHHEFCPLPCELYECRNCRFLSPKVDALVKHITSKHTDAVRVNMASYESSGTDAKIGSESSDDEGTSGVDENDIPDGTASSGMDEVERDGGRRKSKGKKRSAIGALLSSRIANNSRGVGYGGREQFSEECEVYREMVLDEVIEVRSSKKEFQYVSREWTVKFRQRHYAKSMLYSDLRPDVDAQFLTFNQAQDYIPTAARSLRFTLRATNLYNAPIHVPDYAHKWRTLDTFGAEVSGHESLFFCGGPIIAMDWVPLSDRVENRTHQILAVVCKSSHEEFYLAEQMPPQRCLIQIWDVGVLNNATLYKKVENSTPTLLYAIACDFGPIWSLKFCPSGCSNTSSSGDQFNRLGLLAATGANGDVYIFSLASNYNHLITNSYRIISLKPVLRLTLSMTREESSPEYEGHGAVRLAWSKSKHHATIAAGYSNGAVAVWNLNTKSPLLCGQKDATTALLPVHRVFIPDACITAVDLHFTDESRFMLVCNADRKMVVYDLQTGYLPTEVASLNARSKVTTACWNTHFPVIAMAFDDVYAMDRCALTFHQTREIGLRLCPLYTFTAEATDMSASDWLSNHVIGTDGGDVLAHQPLPIVHQMAQKNTAQQKYILTSTMSVKLTDEPTDTSYNMFEKNFGLLFSDNDKNTAKMDLKSLQVKSYRRALLQEYPGIRVNQVRWNPNEGAYQFYAVGYQAGFVRIRAFRLK